MSQSITSSDYADGILILNGASIAPSFLVSYLSSCAPSFSFDWALPVSFVTIAFHVTILILSRHRHNALEVSPYPPALMRPTIGLTAVLSLLWFITTAFMTASLIIYGPKNWYGGLRRMMSLYVVTIVELGVMLAIVFLGIRARKRIQSEVERAVHI